MKRSKASLLNKPAAMKKMLEFKKKAQAGKYVLQWIELNYNNLCNFECSHCYAKNLSGGGRRITVDDVTRLADQADSLGAWQWHLQGGEPLIWPDLEDVVVAIDPSRYHIMITTNGYMMTRERAERLSSIGVDKISVSLDSLDAEEHDALRRQPGSHERAINALFLARDAGIQANINTVVTHQNVRSDMIKEIIDFAEANDFSTLFVAAVPIGSWTGRNDLLIDEDDAAYLLALREQHPVVYRDLYPLFDFEWGCRTLNGIVYIIEDGSLLPCPFIHIALGNVLDEPLKNIIRRGWRIKWFREYSPKCLAAENHEFIDTVLSHPARRKGIVPWEAVFDEGNLLPEVPID